MDTVIALKSRLVIIHAMHVGHLGNLRIPASIPEPNKLFRCELRLLGYPGCLKRLLTHEVPKTDALVQLCLAFFLCGNLACLGEAGC